MNQLPDIPYAFLDQRAAQLRTDFALANPRPRHRGARYERPQRSARRLVAVWRALPVHRHA